MRVSLHEGFADPELQESKLCWDSGMEAERALWCESLRCLDGLGLALAASALHTLLCTVSNSPGSTEWPVPLSGQRAACL